MSTLTLLAALAASATAAPRVVRVALVARQSGDWKAVGLARATLAALCQVGKVHAANVGVAQRVVPTAPDAPAEKLAEAAKLLRAQFLAIVELRGQEAVAELVDPRRATRRRLTAKAPLHELPGSLALALADAMGLRPSEAERLQMAKPMVGSEAAILAMWEGDAAAEPQEQIRLYQAALKGDPASALLHNQLGAALARAGQPARALDEFAEGVRLAPDYAAALTNRGLVLRQQKRWKEAEEAFRAAIALDTKSPTPHIGLARLLDRVGATIEAVEELERAVELDPSHVDALASLAEFYFESYDLRAARRTVRRVLEIEPDHVAALNLLGLLLLVPHDYEEAEAALRKALAAKPDDPETLASLGLALYGQGKADEAITTLQRAIQLAPRLAKAYVYLGRIYLTEKQHGEATEAFQRAAEIDPNMLTARQGLQSARAGAVRSEGGCGCLDVLGSSSSPSDRLPATFLPGALLLGPHLWRLSRRRRKAARQR